MPKIESGVLGAAVAEAATARDVPKFEVGVFGALVDDPASAGDRVDAYLGQIMREAASAASTVNAGLAYAATIAEAVVAADTWSASIPAITPTTFDPATVSNTTLSNGNLTATHSNTTTNSGARSAAVKNSGKYYFEITVITGHGSFDFMGLIKSTGIYGNLIGGTNTTSISRAAGSINTNGSSAAISMGVFNAGAVLGVAVDLDARRAWFLRNGVWNAGGTANPATGTGGVIVEAGSFAPVVTFAGSGTAANDAYTANFGATAFASTVPTGFTAGWPA